MKIVLYLSLFLLVFGVGIYLEPKYPETTWLIFLVYIIFVAFCENPINNVKKEKTTKGT